MEEEEEKEEEEEDEEEEEEEEGRQVIMIPAIKLRLEQRINKPSVLWRTRTCQGA